MNLRIAVIAVGVAVVAGTGCSGQGNNDTAPDSSPVSSDPSTTESPEPQRPPSETAAGHGLLTVVYPSGYDPSASYYSPLRSVSYNVTDPDTGATTNYAEFHANDPYVALAVNSATLGTKLFSPDRKRYAAYKSVGAHDQHAGWVDEAGNFTDVTESAFPNVRGGFSGNEVQIAGNFDSSGAYYFTDKSTLNPDKNGEYPTTNYRLGSDGSLQVIPDVPSSVGGTDGVDYDGNKIHDYYCYGGDFVGWADPNTVVIAWLNMGGGPSKTAPVELDVIPYSFCHNEHWGLTGAITRTLLPGNKNMLYNVSMSADHQTVFFYSTSNADGWTGYFRVPVTGGTPTKTAITNQIASSFGGFIGWV